MVDVVNDTPQEQPKLMRVESEPRRISVSLVLSSVCTVLTLMATILCIVVGILLRQNLDNTPSNQTLKIILPVFVVLFVIFLLVTVGILVTRRGEINHGQTSNEKGDTENDGIS